jgi:hypothetical protein
MKSRTSRNILVAVTALTAVLIASPARADHDDHGDRWDRGGQVLPVPPARVAAAPAYPAPSYRTAPAPVTVAPAPVVAVAPYRPVHWREGRRARELRHEYRELDLTRDRFYATWDGRPWVRARFESWYSSRRAELDQRWAELARWRG